MEIEAKKEALTCKYCGNRFSEDERNSWNYSGFCCEEHQSLMQEVWNNRRKNKACLKCGEKLTRQDNLEESYCFRCSRDLNELFEEIGNKLRKIKKSLK